MRILLLLVFCTYFSDIWGQCLGEYVTINADYWSYLEEYKTESIDDPWFAVEADKVGMPYGRVFEIIGITEDQFQFQILNNKKWGNLKKEVYVAAYACKGDDIKEVYSRVEPVYKVKGGQPHRVNIQMINTSEDSRYFMLVGYAKKGSCFTVRTSQSFRKIQSRSVEFKKRKVLHNIIGRVFNGEGSPAQGIQVSLMTRNFLQTQTAETDERGEFRFNDIDDGENALVKIEVMDQVMKSDVYLFDHTGKATQRAASIARNLYGFSERSHAFSQLRLLSRSDYSIFPSQNKVAVVGRLVDSDTRLYSREGVEIALVDEFQNELKATKTTDNGQFYFPELDDKKYSIRVKGDMSDSYAEMVIVDDSNTPVESANSDFMSADGTLLFRKLPLEEVKLQRMVEIDLMSEETDFSLLETQDVLVLKNVFFESGASQLLPSSNMELEGLIVFLKQHADWKIEISGHTDNEGGADLNVKLSEERAKEVHDYLVLNGIPKSSLTYVGLGKTKHIASNFTDRGRSQNRRVEVKVMK